MAFSRNRYGFMILIAVLISVASSLSLLWYLNAPIYDFLAKQRGDLKPAQVLLVESKKRLSSSEKKAIIKQASDFGALKIVQVHDRTYNEQELSLSSENEISVPPSMLIHALPISAVDSNIEKSNLINRPSNLALLLEPSSDFDGIVRFFDPQNYQQLGMICLECTLGNQKQRLNNISYRPFLINFLNYKTKLPRVSAEQILNDWVPKDVFTDKVVVFDSSVASIKEVYRINLFNKQKVSFSYYTASVLNSVLTEQKVSVLPMYGVLLSLLLVGILLCLFLRDISMNLTLVILPLTALTLFGLNIITLQLLNTFVPVVEFLFLILVWMFFIVKIRNVQVTKDLQTSNGILELALSETNIHKDIRDTTLCSDLHRLFSRAGDIKALSIFEIDESNTAKCVLTLDEESVDGFSLNKLTTAVNKLSSKPELFDFVDQDDHTHSYLLIPVSEFNQLLGCIAISISGTPEVTVNKLVDFSEKYHDELTVETISRLNRSGKITKLNKASSNSMFGRRRTLAHQNRQYVKELTEQYKKSKSNYNRMDSAVAIYDIYGNLTSLNSSAETFAKQTNTVWYGSHLNEILSQISGLSTEKSLRTIDHVLMQGSPYRFTLKGGMRDHIGVLSHRRTASPNENDEKQIRLFLSLEIMNISHIDKSTRLKDSYMKDLANELKQDLSELTLLVDRLSLVEENSDKYQYLSGAIERMNETVRNSRQFIIDLPSIEFSTQYSVNLLDKLDETLKSFEQVFANKNIELICHKPTFLSHIVLDYRNLEFVFNYLFELLLDDSIVDSVLDISIKEKTLINGRSISIIVRNKGYGLPQEVLKSEADNAISHPLKRCKDFAHSHGGHLELSTKVGEGIEFHLELPVRAQLH